VSHFPSTYTLSCTFRRKDGTEGTKTWTRFGSDAQARADLVAFARSQERVGSEVLALSVKREEPKHSS
jgi:hypothetical protein